MIAAPPELPLTTWRCRRCGRIIAKWAGLVGTLEIKCKCNEMNLLVLQTVTK